MTAELRSCQFRNKVVFQGFPFLRLLYVLVLVCIWCGRLNAVGKDVINCMEPGDMRTSADEVFGAIVLQLGVEK